MSWIATRTEMPPVSKSKPDDVRAYSADVLVSVWVGRSTVCASRYVVPDDPGRRPYWDHPDPEAGDLEFVTHWQPTPPPPPDTDLPPVHVVERDGYRQWILTDPETDDKLIKSYHCLADLYTDRSH